MNTTNKGETMTYSYNLEVIPLPRLHIYLKLTQDLPENNSNIYKIFLCIFRTGTSVNKI